jgi:hypothetical protein
MKPRPRKGIAVILAVAMLGLVSVALLSITHALAYDFTRTRLTTQDAQLRQLLLAGAQEAVAAAKGWNADSLPSKWSMHLPASLVEQGAGVSFELEAIEGGQRKVIVTARLGTREQMQSITFRRTDEGWRVFSIE